MELDREAMVRFTEARLDETTDPRIRRNLNTLLAHMRAEIAGDVDALVATLSSRVAYHLWGSPDRSPVGRDEVRGFYEKHSLEGWLYFQFDIEHLLAGPDAIVTEGVQRALVPSESLGLIADDADARVQLLTVRMSVMWRFDDEGLLLGEDTYSSFVSLEPVPRREIPDDHPSKSAA
jgi:SnoaL-like domain